MSETFKRASKAQENNKLARMNKAWNLASTYNKNSFEARIDRLLRDQPNYVIMDSGIPSLSHVFD